MYKSEDLKPTINMKKLSFYKEIWVYCEETVQVLEVFIRLIEKMEVTIMRQAVLVRLTTTQVSCESSI